MSTEKKDSNLLNSRSKVSDPIVPGRDFIIKSSKETAPTSAASSFSWLLFSLSLSSASTLGALGISKNYPPPMILTEKGAESTIKTTLISTLHLLIPM